jgi:hypothetical protein
MVRPEAPPQSASCLLLDLPKLHLEWYAWTMQGGEKPAFLRKPVAYYVMYADKWRYADSLDAVTSATLVGYACEQAELSGRDIGLSLSRGGYRFSRSEHAEWQLLRDGELRCASGASARLSR